MKRYIAFSAVCLFASLPLAAQLQPSRCPAAAGFNPDILLIGSTWVYQIQGVSYWGAAAAGQFTARVSAPVPGSTGIPPRPASNTLDVIDSSSIVVVDDETFPPGARSPVHSRLQPYNGKWSVKADCSGGTLHLNTNLGATWVYDFWFSDSNFSEMVLISTDPGRVYVGTAKRVL